MIGEKLRRTPPVSEFEIVMARETAFFFHFIIMVVRPRNVPDIFFYELFRLPLFNNQYTLSEQD